MGGTLECDRPMGAGCGCAEMPSGRGQRRRERRARRQLARARARVRRGGHQASGQRRGRAELEAGVSAELVGKWSRVRHAERQVPRRTAGFRRGCSIRGSDWIHRRGVLERRGDWQRTLFEECDGGDDPGHREDDDDRSVEDSMSTSRRRGPSRGLPFLRAPTEPQESPILSLARP